MSRTDKVELGKVAQSWRVALLLGAVLSAPAAAFAQPGVVTGQVTRTTDGAAVTTGSVVFCTPTPTLNCYYPTINTAGTYTQAMPAGTYYAYTSNTGLANEIFGDVPCPISCFSNVATQLGTPIVVAPGTKIVRNFALSPYGTLTGTVRDAATRAPLANHYVYIVTRFGDSLSQNYVTTDATGVFSFPSLGTGTFYAYTAAGAQVTHTDEIFGDILCVSSCYAYDAEASGTPIGVTSGAVTNGIEFLLDRGATISGTVRHPTTLGQPAPIDVEVYARVGSNLWRVRTVRLTGGGPYQLTGLAAGTYFVATYNDLFLDEVYNNRTCVGRCQTDEIAAGTPVTVGTGGSATNIDFDLVLGGSLSGTITEAGTGTPLRASVLVFRRIGNTVVDAGSVNSDAAGAYQVQGLATGSYAVIALDAVHVPEFYGGFQCVGCSTASILSAATVPVTTGLNTQGVNVTMDRAATISGTLRRSPSNTTVPNTYLRLFTAGPAPVNVAVAVTDSNGAYTFDGLTAGAYFASTATTDLANEVYDNVACPGGTCSTGFIAANGQAINVPASGAVTGIDFALGPPSGLPGPPSTPVATTVGGGVRFTWSAGTLGGPPTSYVFEAGLTAGTTFVSLPVATNAFFVPGVPPGTYFVRVRGVNATGLGEASPELTLRVGGGSVVAPNAPTNVMTYVADGRLTATWYPPQSGATPSSYLLEVGTAAGLSNIAVVPVAGRVFLFSGVPPGYYFMRVRAVAGGAVGPPSSDVILVVGNVAAPPTAPIALTSSVAGNVVTLTWYAPTFGPVTSYVLEAGTASGLANITTFNTGNAATSLVIPGVPPGRYYLRLRALNAQGSSPPSFEHVLIVP